MSMQIGLEVRARQGLEEEKEQDEKDSDAPRMQGTAQAQATPPYRPSGIA